MITQNTSNRSYKWSGRVSELAQQKTLLAKSVISGRPGRVIVPPHPTPNTPWGNSLQPGKLRPSIGSSRSSTMTSLRSENQIKYKLLILLLYASCMSLLWLYTVCFLHLIIHMLFYSINIFANCLLMSNLMPLLCFLHASGTYVVRNKILFTKKTF